MRPVIKLDPTFYSKQALQIPPASDPSFNFYPDREGDKTKKLINYIRFYLKFFNYMQTQMVLSFVSTSRVIFLGLYMINKTDHEQSLFPSLVPNFLRGAFFFLLSPMISLCSRDGLILEGRTSRSL